MEMMFIGVIGNGSGMSLGGAILAFNRLEGEGNKCCCWLQVLSNRNHEIFLILECHAKRYFEHFFPHFFSYALVGNI